MAKASKKKAAKRGRPVGSTNKSHEMHGTNPKAAESAQKKVEKDGRKIKDGMKKAAISAKGLAARTLEFIKSIPGKCVNGAKRLYGAVVDVLKNFMDTAKAFFQGLTERETWNRTFAKAKIGFGIVGAVTLLALGVSYITEVFTLTEILTGTSIGSGLAYAGYRATLDPETAKNTRVSLKDAFIPNAGSVAA